MAAPSTPSVLEGRVHVVFAYDIGLSIDLARARQHVSELTEMAAIKHKGHAPTWFQFDPPPLHMTQAIGPVDPAQPMGIGRWRTDGGVDVVLYDFGGVSVSYTIPFSGTLEDLIALSCALSGTPVFLEDSRRRMEHILSVVESAVDRASIAAVTEDYLIFGIQELGGGLSIEDFLARHARDLARILRSESDPLSEQEVADAMASRVSFGRDDVALIDWNAAFLVDREPEDVRSVLEFANLQLLEARFLDQALDRALDRSYEVLVRPRAFRRLRRPGETRAELDRVARLQVESAILFERVGNALKLLGDQYLARVYRAASTRYRLAEWNAGILRKLETIESIYQKVHDQAAGLRMEVLEWIIIVLIAVSIALPFVAGGPGH